MDLERGYCCDIGVRYTCTLLAQSHEQERIFAHAIGETDAASAAHWGLGKWMQFFLKVYTGLHWLTYGKLCVIF
jgi:hypothetical protein